MSTRNRVFIAIAAIGIAFGFWLGRQTPDANVVNGEPRPKKQHEPAKRVLTAIRSIPPENPKPQAQEEANAVRLAKLNEAKMSGDYVARYNALSPIFKEWARNDPEAAFDAWVDTPGCAGMGLSFLIISQLHQANGFEATLKSVRAIENPTSRQEAQRHLGGELHATSDPRAAAEMLFNALQKSERSEPMSAAIVAWRTQADIDTVWNWVESKREQLDGAALAVLERSAAQGLFSSNPDTAIEWLMSRATDVSRSGHLASIAGNWARIEPNAAAEWLGSLPPGPQNDDALATFAQRIAADDPESAAHWASSITNSRQRKENLEQVIARWRVIDPAAAAKFEQAQE